MPVDDDAMQRRPLIATNDDDDDDDDRRRRRAAAAPVPMLLCCCALAAAAVVIVVVSTIAATRTTSCAPPAPPSAPLGACCTGYTEDTCVVVANTSCAGQWYGAGSQCEPTTCESTPPQCQCTAGRIEAAPRVLGVRPSQTAGRCLEIDVALVCTDRRPDPRCLPRSNGVAWRVRDETGQETPNALVVAEWTAGAFSCTSGGGGGGGSPDTALDTFSCFSALAPRESATTVVRLAVGDATFIEQNAQFLVETTKAPGSDLNDPEAPPPCDDTFAIVAAEQVSTLGLGCGGGFGAQTPGACCIEPSSGSGGHSTCFEHTTRTSCSELVADNPQFDSAASFEWTAGATCADVGCTRTLPSEEEPCVTWANTADGVTTASCASAISTEDARLLTITNERAALTLCRGCDARTGCCTLPSRSLSPICGEAK